MAGINRATQEIGLEHNLKPACMRTLLRHIGSGEYFQALERWTLDRDEAYDFGMIPRALNFAHRASLVDTELILAFDDREQVPGIPLEKFRLGLTRHRRRSRS